MPNISLKDLEKLSTNLSTTLMEINNSKNPDNVALATKKIYEAAVNLIINPSEATINSYKNQLDSAASAIPKLKDGKNIAKITKIFTEALPGSQNQELREYFELPLLERLNQKQKEEINSEIENSPHSINKNDKDSRKKAVEDTLRDKNTAQQTGFEVKGDKPTGLSAGYIAKEAETGKTFILKQFYKNYIDCQNLDVQLTPKDRQKARKMTLDEKQKQNLNNFISAGFLKQNESNFSDGEKYIIATKRYQAVTDRRDGVQELIASTMYQFLLYDQAPKEALVQPDEDHFNSLYVRGKFFENAVTLAEFSKCINPTHIDFKNKNLKDLEGFEKVMAACHMLGEVDYHAGNLMVQNGKTVNKIDHGRSFIEYFDNFDDMIITTANKFNSFGYNKAINGGNLSFNIDKYSTALNQMVEQLNNDQIENIVDQKIAELKKANFDPKNISVVSIINGKTTQHHINNYEDLKNFYNKQLTQNRDNMKEIAMRADIISKFSDMNPKFKNGMWLHEFAAAKIKDPVLFAAERNIKIEGKNALQWAYENDYKIQSTSNTQKKVESQESQWTKNSKNKWQQQNVTVTKNETDFTFYDPIEYLRLVRNTLKFSEDEKEFLYNAHKYDLKDPKGRLIKDKIPEMGFDTEGLTAKLYDKQDQNISNKLTSLATNFSNQTLKGNVTEKEVEAFYDKALETLKKENYLNSKDIEIIKKDKDYKQNIKETTNLINLNTVELSTKEKICYKLANFCNKIKLSAISNHLIKHGISLKNLEKLQKTDKVITTSMKFGENLIKYRSNEGIQIKRLKNLQDKLQISVKKARGKSVRH